MSTCLNNRPWAPVMAVIGLLLIVIATAMPLLRVEGEWYKYLYCAGAVMAFAGRLLTPTPAGVSLRVRRMLRLEAWSALLFIVAGVFLFVGSESSRDWVAFTLAGGVIQVYTSVMLGRQAK